MHGRANSCGRQTLMVPCVTVADTQPLSSKVAIEAGIVKILPAHRNQWLWIRSRTEENIFLESNTTIFM